jgi:hypothetical protein
LAAGKAAALTLFPTIFIVLFSWATAGSTSGNTVEPMRGAGWLWLAIHLTPFRIVLTGAGNQSLYQVGALTFLPLAGIALPYLALRRSWRAMVALLGEVAGISGRIIFAATYSLIAIVIAWSSATSHVRAIWWLSALSSFALALLVTWQSNHLAPLLSVIKNLAVLFFALALILFAANLLLHYRAAITLSRVIDTGYLGGLAYLFIQLLYLPNFALAIFGFFTGSGFSVGPGTIATYAKLQLHQIPGLPIFAVLPTRTYPILKFTFLFWLIPLLITAMIVNKRNSHLAMANQVARLLPHLVIWPALVFVATYLSSGELITPGLNRVGVLPLRSALLALIGEAISLIIISAYLAGKKLMQGRLAR